MIFKFSLLVESQQGKTGKRQSLIILSTDPLLELSAAIINLDWLQQLSIENKHNRMAQNSWQAHLGVANTTNKANGNFATFIDTLNIRNLKNDRINSLTEDANGIVIVLDNSFKVKIIHSCKKISGTCTNPIVTWGASPVSAQGHSPSSLTQIA